MPLGGGRRAGTGTARPGWEASAASQPKLIQDFSRRTPMPERYEAAYLRTSEVADLLGVSPKTVSRWAKEGKLPFLKTLGGHRRYPEAEIRMLADTLAEPETSPGAID